jgi:hypothetical protein
MVLWADRQVEAGAQSRASSGGPGAKGRAVREWCAHRPYVAPARRLSDRLDVRWHGVEVALVVHPADPSQLALSHPVTEHASDGGDVDASPGFPVTELDSDDGVRELVEECPVR